MEFISDVVPSPEKMEHVKDTEGREIVCDANGKPVLLVFKTSTEEHIGEICYFKVLSGTITEGIDLYNPKNNTKERLSAIYACAGKTKNKVDSLSAGDIGATVKLKGTKYGHTLVAPGEDNEIPQIVYPAYKYRVAVKAVNESEAEKLIATKNNQVVLVSLVRLLCLSNQSLKVLKLQANSRLMARNRL